MKDINVTTQQIDALFPQTQCGDCSYAGCMPYAKAIVEDNEKINRCVPGGMDTLIKIGDVVNQDITPLVAELEAQQKPKVLAKIIEDQCIGCTKCIQACPVDAIIGSAKLMHTIISQECTGCGLCIEPCPVDCIELSDIDEHQYEPNKARQRYELRNQRIKKLKQQKINKYQSNKLHVQTREQQDKLAAKRKLIMEAVKRAKKKKEKNHP